MKRVFQYQYDACNRIVGVNSDLEQVRFHYDQAGNLTQQSIVRTAAVTSKPEQSPPVSAVEHQFCEQCGAMLTPTARYCAACGTPIAGLG